MSRPESRCSHMYYAEKKNISQYITAKEHMLFHFTSLVYLIILLHCLRGHDHESNKVNMETLLIRRKQDILKLLCICQNRWKIHSLQTRSHISQLHCNYPVISQLSKDIVLKYDFLRYILKNLSQHFARECFKRPKHTIFRKI